MAKRLIIQAVAGGLLVGMVVLVAGCVHHGPRLPAAPLPKAHPPKVYHAPHPPVPLPPRLP